MLSTRKKFRDLMIEIQDGAAILCLITTPVLFGQIAQLVEQRTENPCVGGSSPPLATTITHKKRH